MQGGIETSPPCTKSVKPDKSWLYSNTAIHPKGGKDGGSHHRLTIPTKLKCKRSSARCEVSGKPANSPSKRAKLDGSTLSAPRPRSLGHGPYSTYSHLVGSNSGIEQKLRLPRKVNFISLHARYSLTSLQ